jgi:hypothetical protein
MKKCGKCQELKERAEFPRNKRRKDGLGSWCLLCHTEHERAKRAKKREAEEREAERERIAMNKRLREQTAWLKKREERRLAQVEKLKAAQTH